MDNNRVNWLREAISDGRSGRASTKRITMLLAAVTLSISTLALVAALLLGQDASQPLTVFGSTLGLMAGAGYVGGKGFEARREEKESP